MQAGIQIFDKKNYILVKKLPKNDLLLRNRTVYLLLKERSLKAEPQRNRTAQEESQLMKKQPSSFLHSPDRKSEQAGGRMKFFTLIELLVGTCCFPGCFRQKYEV